MDEYKNKYPFNALRDMGYSDEMIDRCSFSLRWSFYDLIRNGLFNKERYKILHRRMFHTGYIRKHRKVI